MPEGKTTTRTRQTSWEDPQAIGATAAEMTGLDFMRALRDHKLPAPPIAVTVGFELTEAEEGRTVFTCTPGEHHYNLIGSVHGGLVATLVDSATGTAVHTTLAKGELYGTVNLSVDMLRPVTDKTGTLITEGVVVHRGRNIAIATAEAKGEADGKVYARGQATCFIFKVGERGG